MHVTYETPFTQKAGGGRRRRRAYTAYHSAEVGILNVKQ